MEIRFYKIRHIPTGLYFKPNGNSHVGKTNLTPQGKTYSKKPSFTYLGKTVYFNKPEYSEVLNNGYKEYVMKVKLDDWEIVEFLAVEVSAVRGLND